MPKVTECESTPCEQTPSKNRWKPSFQFSTKKQPKKSRMDNRLSQVGEENVADTTMKED